MTEQGKSRGAITVGAAGATRTDRRRARTRGALIAAARSILAEQGPTDVSIQQITHLADVGFGSFYNHFTSKSELFEAAVADAMAEYGALLGERTAGLDDPAEVLAVSVRLTGRLPDSHPQVARLLTRAGPAGLRAGRAPKARLVSLIEAGSAAGRFQAADPWAALAGVAGSLFGLLELRMSRPEVAAPDACEQLAELVLRMLGVAPGEAAELARRPLPSLVPLPTQA